MPAIDPFKEGPSIDGPPFANSLLSPIGRAFFTDDLPLPIKLAIGPPMGDPNIVEPLAKHGLPRRAELASPIKNSDWGKSPSVGDPNLHPLRHQIL